MLKLALRARENAYAPYSKFKVGACVKSAATGKLYAGCNVENSSFGATICAERNAITTALTAEGIIGIETLVVVSDDEPPAPPCALCLQVLAEFTSPDSLVILSSLEGCLHHPIHLLYSHHWRGKCAGIGSVSSCPILLYSPVSGNEKKCFRYYITAVHGPDIMQQQAA